MITKLTLTIERSLIAKAKQHAKSQGSSLSEIISNYLKKLDKQTMGDAVARPPITRSLKGSFKAPENINYKKVLSEELGEKYL